MNREEFWEITSKGTKSAEEWAATATRDQLKGYQNIAEELQHEFYKRMKERFGFTGGFCCDSWADTVFGIIANKEAFENLEKVLEEEILVIQDNFFGTGKEVVDFKYENKYDGELLSYIGLSI